MAKKHLAIIDPAVKTPELDCFNQLSLRAGIKTSYHLPALFGMDSLRAHEDSLTGLIILGSSSSVNDRHPWQAELENWLKPQLEKKIPTLGFCYGHQMLAYLYGGKVDFMFSDKRKLQGFRKIRINPNAIWSSTKTEGEVYVSHREAVLECPLSMQVLASSAEVAIDGLAHKTLPIWSFQSHPESTPLFLKNMGDKSPLKPQQFDFGKQIIDTFLGHIQTT
jgi:GMP synthase (glutamine-hydrolysing)